MVAAHSKPEDIRNVLSGTKFSGIRYQHCALYSDSLNNDVPPKLYLPLGRRAVSELLLRPKELAGIALILLTCLFFRRYLITTMKTAVPQPSHLNKPPSPPPPPFEAPNDTAPTLDTYGHDAGFGGEESVLLSIKNYLSADDPFFDSWQFSESGNFCTWRGVKCNKEYSVVSLKLELSEAAEGRKFPRDLFCRLPSLEEIAASNIQLMGLLPKLSCLEMLKVLDLSGNLLSGPFKWEMTFPSLSYLDLSRNSINEDVDDLFDWMNGSLSKLNYLNFSRNSFFGSISKALGTHNQLFSALEVLDLSQNSISGPPPFVPNYFPVLKHANLAGNQFSGKIPYIQDSGERRAKFSKTLRGTKSASQFDTLDNLSSLRYLDLQDNRLEGPLPSDWITQLSLNLEVLNLSNNSLSGTIPSKLKNCLNLRQLDLSLNMFLGEIPELCGAILQKNALEALKLDGNYLNGSLSEGLLYCRNLSVISVSENTLSGTIPPLYFSESSLKVLNLSHNKFSGKFPANFYANFTVLSLAGNEFSGKIPSAFGDISTLQVLDLEKNYFSGEIPSSFRNLNKLETLNLGGNMISGNPWDILGNLTFLKFLNLSGNEVKGQISDGFGEYLTNLVYFEASRSQLSGPIPSSLGSSINLLELHLQFNEISGSVPEELGNLQNLRVLDLRGNKLSEFPSSLFSNLTSLEILKLNSNSIGGNLNGANFDRSSLMVLDLSENELSGKLPSSLGSAKALEVLLLHRNKFSGAIPLSFEQLTSLKALNLSYNWLTGKIPGGGLQNFTGSTFMHNSGLCGPPIQSKCLNPLFSRQRATWILSLTFGFLILSAIIVIFAIVYRRRNSIPGKFQVLIPVRGGEKLTVDDLKKAVVSICPLSGPNPSRGGVEVREIGPRRRVFEVKFSSRMKMASKLFRGEEGVNLAVEEINNVCAISHPNVVSLRGYYVGKDFAILFYDFVPGGSIAELIGRLRSPLPTQRKLNLLVGVARGLLYLHSLETPLVHRDIKPDNIMVGEEENVPKIIDFGLSKKLLNGRVLTRTGGTPGFMAPECRSRESSEYNEATDVYSFGVLLLSLLFERIHVEGLVEEAKTTYEENSSHDVLFNSLLSLGLISCDHEPTNRPNMRSALERLEALQQQSFSFDIES